MSVTGIAAWRPWPSCRGGNAAPPPLECQCEVISSRCPQEPGGHLHHLARNRGRACRGCAGRLPGCRAGEPRTDSATTGRGWNPRPSGRRRMSNLKHNRRACEARPPRRPIAAMARPASAITGPATAQKVTPDITLPPRTPTPCRVKMTPASVTRTPTPTSTTRLMMPPLSRVTGPGPAEIPARREYVPNGQAVQPLLTPTLPLARTPRPSYRPSSRLPGQVRPGSPG